MDWLTVRLDNEWISYNNYKEFLAEAYSMRINLGKIINNFAQNTG